MIMFFLTYMIFLLGSLPLHMNTIRAWFFWKAFHLVLWIGCIRRKGKKILKTYPGSQKSTRKLPKFPIKRIDAFVKTRQVDWRSGVRKQIKLKLDSSCFPINFACLAYLKQAVTWTCCEVEYFYFTSRIRKQFLFICDFEAWIFWP